MIDVTHFFVHPRHLCYSQTSKFYCILIVHAHGMGISMSNYERNRFCSALTGEMSLSLMALVLWHANPVTGLVPHFRFSEPPNLGS